MPGMARTIEQDDRGTQRVPEDDRPGDPDGVAEAVDVIRAGLEAPRTRVAPVRSAMPAQVEVDDLGVLRKRGECGLEVGVVVDARAAVYQQDGRPLSHVAS